MRETNLYFLDLLGHHVPAEGVHGEELQPDAVEEIAEVGTRNRGVGAVVAGDVQEHVVEHLADRVARNDELTHRARHWDHRKPRVCSLHPPGFL
jgi:hypothetical protein